MAIALPSYIEEPGYCMYVYLIIADGICHRELNSYIHCGFSSVNLLRFIIHCKLYSGRDTVSVFVSLLQCPSIFLKQEPSVVLYADMGPDFQFLYQKVCSSMSAIHTSHGTSAKVKDFVRLAQEW